MVTCEQNNKDQNSGSFIFQHYKNKLVVLTREWLPWLQSSWRDSGYERFALHGIEV